MNLGTSFVTPLSSTYASPLVTRERFAEMVFGSRDAVGIIVGWCNKGLVPTVTIGKYSLISLELLRKQCLDQEFT